MADEIRELARLVASFDRRLRALESAPRAPFTSIQGGYLRVLTSDADTPAMELGSTVADGDDVAFQVVDEDGGASGIYIGTNLGRLRADLYNADRSRLVLRYDDGQLAAPQISCAWNRYVGSAMDGNGMSTTNSATFLDLWHTVLPLGTDQINTVIDIIPDGGVTAEVRIIGVAIGGIPLGTPNTAQTIDTDTGITTTVVMQGPWTVPDSIWVPSSDPAGALVWLTIQARITAGGPSVVHVAPRLPAWVTS